MVYCNALQLLLQSVAKPINGWRLLPLLPTRLFQEQQLLIGTALESIGYWLVWHTNVDLKIQKHTMVKNPEPASCSCTCFFFLPRPFATIREIFGTSGVKRERQRSISAAFVRQILSLSFVTARWGHQTDLNTCSSRQLLQLCRQQEALFFSFYRGSPPFFP